MWSTAMKIALVGKNKFGFVDGTCVKPVTSHVLAQQWERCNAIVLEWILSSLSPELYLGQVYSQIASEVWDELEETYDKMDGSVIFNVIHKINGLKQGELSVPEYYHKLNSLWREFDTLTLLPACTCAAHEWVLKHNQLSESDRGTYSELWVLGFWEPTVSLLPLCLMSVHKLIKDSKLFVGFDETKYYIQDLNLVKTVGTSSEAAGPKWLGHPTDQVLSIISKSIGFKYDKHVSPCDIYHKAKQTRDPFPLSDHKSVALGDLVHLDLWGPYKVVSKDGYSFVEIILTQFDKKIKVFRSDKGGIPLNMWSEYILTAVYLINMLPSSVLSGSSPYFHTSEIPFDDEREQSKDDGNVMAPNNINSSQTVDEDATFATSLTKNTNISEGQHGTDASIPRIISDGLNSSNSGYEPTDCENEPKMYSRRKCLIRTGMESYEIMKWKPCLGYTWVALVDFTSTNRKTIAKGFSQRNGIDYEETFSPVVKMVTVRCIISLVVHYNWPLFQLDVNDAFLYGDLHEDVYMDLPPGYYDPSETRVCKLVKSLYGLKQAPRQWNEKLTSVLNEHGFVHSMNDYSLFVKHDSDNILILLVYVDYIVITGSNLDEIDKFKRFLASKFQIKDLGSLKYFLGIEVLENKNGLCLSQRKYCMELLSEYGLLACKPVATPMQQNVSLSHIETEKDKKLKNLTAYQKLIGKLIYLSVTRPDISYVVHCLSQHMHSLLQSHFSAGLRVLKYLKQSLGVGIQFYNGNKMSLHAYSDADWAKCLISRKSVSGFCVYFYGNLVSWKSKKRVKDVRSRTTISSTSAIQIAANPVFHEKTKHFEIDVHLVREKVSSGTISTVKINSAENIVDVFTKGLSITQHKQFCLRLNLVDMFQV
ncbi:putative RNA-directed DNA polymerase [Tanacetum coccineum]